MRRHVTLALLFVLGLAVSGLVAASPSAQAAEIRFPKAGPYAFIINLPPAWSSKEDDYGGLQVIAPDRASVIYLSMASDKEYMGVGRPLRDLATAIAKSAGATLTDKQEPAILSGITGETFYGEMTNDRGTLLQVKMVIIPMAIEVAATQTILTTANMSAAQRTALDQALRGISLTGKR